MTCLASGVALRRRRFALAADGAGQIHRRHARCPLGPLRVGRLIGELGDGAELFAAQPPACAASATCGSRSSARAVSLVLPGGALRHAVVGGHVLVERVGPSNTRVTASLSTRSRRSSRTSSTRRARSHSVGRAAQLIELVPDVEHETSQTRGYDTYHPDRKNRIDRPEPSPEKEAATP